MSSLLAPVTGPPVAAPPPGPRGRSFLPEGPPTREGFADCLGQAQTDSTKARTAIAEGQTKEAPKAEAPADQPVVAPAGAPLVAAPAEVAAPVPGAAPVPVAAPVPGAAADPRAGVAPATTPAPAEGEPVGRAHLGSPLPAAPAAPADGDGDAGSSGAPALAGKAEHEHFPDEPLGRFVAAAAHEAKAARVAAREIAGAATTPVAPPAPVAAPVAAAPAAPVAAPVAAAPSAPVAAPGAAVPAAPATASAAALAAPAAAAPVAGPQVTTSPAPAHPAEAPEQLAAPAPQSGSTPDGEAQQHQQPQTGSLAQPVPAVPAQVAAGSESPLAATVAAPDGIGAQSVAHAATVPQPAQAEAHAATHPEATPVPLRHASEVAKEVLQLATRQGVTHARIALSPAELGGIEVHLTYSSAGVVAQLVADSPAAAQVLERAADDLRKALERQDQTVLALDVSTREDRQAGGSRLDRSHTDGQGRPVDGRSGAERAAATEPGAAVRSMSLSTGVLVDVLA